MISPDAIAYTVITITILVLLLMAFSVIKNAFETYKEYRKKIRKAKN